DLRNEDVRHVSLLLWSRTRLRRGYHVRLAEGHWSERGVTFANAPMFSPEFVASGRARATNWKAVDITSLITGEEHSLSLVLTTPSLDGGRVGGHPVTEARFARMGAYRDGAGQVALVDDSDETAAGGDDDRADAFGNHLLRGVADRVEGLDREHVARHHFAEGGHGGE